MSVDDSKEDMFLNLSEKVFFEEQGRQERLETKAEKYLGAIGLITGLGLYSITHLMFYGDLVKVISSWFAIGAFTSLGIALIIAVESRRIRNYVSFPRGTKLIDDLDVADIDTDTAKKSIAILYLNARTTNAAINDRRAKLLSWSERLIIIGFILGVISYLVPKIF
jgi:hypothetical protein